MRDYEELIGADYIEHNVHRPGLDLTRTVSVLGDRHDDVLRGHVPVGKNKVSNNFHINVRYQCFTGSHGLSGVQLC